MCMSVYAYVYIYRHTHFIKLMVHYWYTHRLNCSLGVLRRGSDDISLRKVMVY